MNHRVLELLKTPKNIQSEDLNLLKEEINSFPYIQNIRALYLYGVHLYDKENYQKALSTTAAYTTDKKILYQLINGKIQQKPKAEIVSETVKEKIIPAENPLQLLLRSKASVFPLKREEEAVAETQPETVEDKTGEVIENESSFGIPPEPKPEAKEVFVNGERNRILFEGEENFLEDENVEVIDLESTLESGSIITQKLDKKQDAPIENQYNTQENKSSEIVEAESFTPGTIIEEEKIHSESEKEEVLNKSELNLHETESFLTDVRIAPNETEQKSENKNTELQEQDDSLSNTEEVTEFTPETIINEDKISSEEQETLQDDSELSFHGMESFLPEVKIQPNTEDKVSEISQPNLSKHEDEMRRLIEEVERKMKEKAASESPKIKEEPENTGNGISFSETQSFEVKSEESKSEKVIKEPFAETNAQPESSEKQVKEISEEKIMPAEQTSEVNTSWRPMSFEANLPDSLLNKTAETAQPQPEISLDNKTEAIQNEKSKEKLPQNADITKPAEKITKEAEGLTGTNEERTAPEAEIEKKEEAPVMNVSFFGSGWAIPHPEKKEEKTEELEENKKEKETFSSVENKKSNLPDSNVQGFINTWQSWLKIDRSEDTKKDKTEIKNKVIETFIETNPKISQLKEESNFTVKEKGDDISHLMTETLANLYLEQKLYTKAVKAFEALIKKTPEKKEYYETKIQEIKDFRTKG
ncbi:hypothetical protein [Chryseobacterium salviniae]|uniref:Tetratricopeptide repeat protein n=1 Tax=Chryseobacterium salviniae TaxID=3101750 RepID=A0ABU6HVD4_9FLAO|nr:hypothetical protein [Chryseobacterium sp. T9W2-O]MEC3877022.1 hypothetical protein [Chryseobacterium sp. T9W2-O]